MSAISSIKAFDAPYAPDDADFVPSLLAGADLGPEAEARIDLTGLRLISAIRARAGGLGGVEDVLREYALSTKEGLALMVLAEALLRVPDAATADRLIEDKLGQGDFAHHEPKSGSLLVSASAWALGVTARIIQPGETPDGVLAALAKRVGLPTARLATRQAMRVMGSHFVLGETIGAALERAGGGAARRYRYSYDMLGEGARTAADAARHLAAYADAIEAIGRSAGNARLPDRPGISVKLSALHPRYEATSRARVLRELVPRVLGLARAAKAHDLNFTVDAEEADRLEISLEVIGAVAADPSLAGWDGFGLAIQAYHKRAMAAIDWVEALATTLDRRMMVRLVKGAYWDSEVKRAQERGLTGYPVFTRKAMTDLNYLACAQRLLAARPRLYPQFATHNALTVAAIVERAGGLSGYEFQRLHGMGEALYDELLRGDAGAACRTYAPVGGHRDLLAYLVRRLLENGANSSFVAKAGDPAIPPAELLKRPWIEVATPADAAHPRLPAPVALFGKSRRNSSGVEFGHRASLDALLAEVTAGDGPARAAPLIAGVESPGAVRPVLSPIDGRDIGRVVELAPADAGRVVAAAKAGFPAWSLTPALSRATILDRAADLMEARRGRLLWLMNHEAGKTLDDALAELREAVDFLRYYAAETRRLFVDPVILPGPTGESNALSYRGRGVFLCISPWNFPLAIFIGQVAAALAAGNAVIAKPAEQTPLIAGQAVAILREAGLPAGALHLATGDGAVGAALVAHPDIAGVAFTGSTEVARRINRALAAKDGPIVPLIAETGGLNAMIVDATALPEQVADDVATSAFRSAGQRCSALRLLCLQEDVADGMLAMILGAARELTLGDPADVATHIGPVIDADAHARLNGYLDARAREGRLILDGRKERTPPPGGWFVPPCVVGLDRPEDLTEEVFGPVLHVVRWKAADRDRLIAAIAASGYGLTLGVHSRIDETIARIVAGAPVGNIYVNRNMIGAVVGSQPFGGHGLSGTGPKAGGPNYLTRFAAEQVVTINTAAAGGDASLLSESA